MNDAHRHMASDINRVCNSVVPGWKTEGVLSTLSRGRFTITASATGGIRPSEIAVYAVEKRKPNGIIPCCHSLSNQNTYTRQIDGNRTSSLNRDNPESWLRLALTEVLEWVDSKNSSEKSRFDIKLIERLRRFIRLTSC